MDLAVILDDCLTRLREGETEAAALSHYGGAAAELAPMLAVAGQLQTLSAHHLSPAQRERAKATLRRSLAARPTPAFPAFGPWLRSPRSLALAGAAACLVLAFLATNAVAASRPGQAAYRLRVIAERAPLVLQTSPAGRAGGELAVADRRLADLRDHLTAAGHADPVALEALLQSDDAAARRALAAREEWERARIAVRIATHAQTLAELAEGAPDPRAAEHLRLAARRATQLAERVRSGETPAAPQPVVTPKPSPAASPEEPARPTATPTPGPTEASTPGDELAARPTTGHPPATALPEGGPPPPLAETRAALRSATPPPFIETRQTQRTTTPPPSFAETRQALRSATPPPLIETRQALRTATPPPPFIETRQALRTATPPPPVETRQAQHTATPTGARPTDAPGQGGARATAHAETATASPRPGADPPLATAVPAPGQPPAPRPGGRP
jgi:hypothetical protein